MKNYSMMAASEHKYNENKCKTLPGEFYGYVYVSHDDLGEFYVSVSMDKNDVRVDGKPWNFLAEDEYKLTDAQIEFVETHKKEFTKSRW